MSETNQVIDSGNFQDANLITGTRKNTAEALVNDHAQAMKLVTQLLQLIDNEVRWASQDVSVQEYDLGTLVNGSEALLFKLMGEDRDEAEINHLRLLTLFVRDLRDAGHQLASSN